MSRHIAILLLLLLPLIPASALDGNIKDGCVSDFDADVDYFPDKIELRHAEKLTVSYHKHYKVVTVSDAFDSAPSFVYALVQCGAPMPDEGILPAEAQVISVPAGNLISLSTTQLPPLVLLGLLDWLAGVGDAAYVSTPEIVEGVAEGAIAEVGFGASINIELALSLQPDLALTYGLNPATDAHPVLLEAGILAALDASWRESSPLGRAEWLKFPALFYNLEAEATALHDDTAAAYDEALQLTADLPAEERPALLLNSFLGYADAWHIPGAESYAGQMMRDAGARLLLSVADSRESMPYSFEAVYDAALDADVWLTQAFGLRTMDGLLAQESRYADFAAFEAGAVWNNNADETPSGGNNYYEWGVTQPHVVLRDLIAIFHPQLLPDHEFAFYRQLTNE